MGGKLDLGVRALNANVLPSATVAVSQALDERAWRAVVDASTARAQRAGVTGVPVLPHATRM